MKCSSEHDFIIEKQNIVHNSATTGASVIGSHGRYGFFNYTRWRFMSYCNNATLLGKYAVIIINTSMEVTTLMCCGCDIIHMPSSVILFLNFTLELNTFYISNGNK